MKPSVYSKARAMGFNPKAAYILDQAAGLGDKPKPRAQAVPAASNAVAQTTTAINASPKPDSHATGSLQTYVQPASEPAMKAIYVSALLLLIVSTLVAWIWRGSNAALPFAIAVLVFLVLGRLLK